MLSQVANGVLLPFVLFYMLSLINRKHVMHEYKNNFVQNLIAGATSITMIALTAKCSVVRCFKAASL